jgi:hypothetical protein
MSELHSLEEILAYLKTQALLRSPENDEAGVLWLTRDVLLAELKDLGPGYENIK